jgi:tetratricopeptide (TPR) repeat protein
MKAVLHEQQEILGPDNLQVEQSHGRLGGLWLKASDPQSAIGSLQEALRISTVHSAGKPTSALAICRLNLGVMFANAHRYNEALNQWREADRTYSSLVGADSENARMARSGIALALTKLGEFDEADAMFAALLEHPFRSTAEEVLIKSRLGVLRSAQGRHEEALALLREASDSLANAPDRVRALALAALGDALLASGKMAESLAVLQPARAQLLSSQPNSSPDLADIAVDITRAQIGLGRGDDAVAAAHEAMAFWRRFAPEQRDAGIALLWQARAFAAVGRAPEATAALREATLILDAHGMSADRALLEQTRLGIRTPPSVRR